jgi:hypothetical protein
VQGVGNLTKQQKEALGRMGSNPSRRAPSFQAVDESQFPSWHLGRDWERKDQSNEQRHPGPSAHYSECVVLRNFQLGGTESVSTWSILSGFHLRLSPGAAASPVWLTVCFLFGCSDS